MSLVLGNMPLNMSPYVKPYGTYLRVTSYRRLEAACTGKFEYVCNFGKFEFVYTPRTSAWNVSAEVKMNMTVPTYSKLKTVLCLWATFAPFSVVFLVCFNT